LLAYLKRELGYEKIVLLLIIVFATSVSVSNISKKTGIKAVKVTIAPQLEKKDEVFYSLAPLGWDDFAGTADTNSEWQC
jgi:hypothetical protein